MKNSKLLEICDAFYNMEDLSGIENMWSTKFRVVLRPHEFNFLKNLLERYKLWIIYAAINKLIIVEESGNFDIDSCKSTLKNDEAMLIENEQVTELKKLSSQLEHISPATPSIRLVKYSSSVERIPNVGKFSPSGSYCALSVPGEGVALIPAVNGVKDNLQSLDIPADDVHCLKFSKDDSFLFAASGSNLIHWKITTKSGTPFFTPVPSLSLFQPLWTIATSPLSLFVACGYHDSSVYLHDVSHLNSELSIVRIFADLHPNTTHAPAVASEFHSNCTYLAVGHSDGQVVMWDINDACPVRKFKAVGFS